MTTEEMLVRGWRQLHAATQSSLSDFLLRDLSAEARVLGWDAENHIRRGHCEAELGSIMKRFFKTQIKAWVLTAGW